MLLPFQLLLSFALGIVSLGVLGLSLYLGVRGLRQLRKRRLVFERQTPGGPAVATGAISPVSPAPASLLALFIIPVLLLLWTFTGRYLILASRPGSTDEPREVHSDTVQTLTRPNGSKLHVEFFGPAGAPTLVLTHGWSLDSAEWFYVKQQLGQRYRLVVWDLPGLGQSTRPDNGDYSLDTMADDLGAVVDAAGPRVVLAGHSIGGMINLTYCRRFPDKLGKQVVGVVEMNTTYTDPVKTTKDAQKDIKLQGSVFEPLLHVMIPLSPLIRVMNWLSYENGLAQIQAKSSYAGTETRGQLDFAAAYNYKSSTAVIARGMLGMLHWDATSTLPNIRVPVLILDGEQDTTTLPEASQQMQQSIPNAVLRPMQPAAHLGVLERNAEYNAEIARFVDRCWQ